MLYFATILKNKLHIVDGKPSIEQLWNEFIGLNGTVVKEVKSAHEHQSIFFYIFIIFCIILFRKNVIHSFKYKLKGNNLFNRFCKI